MRQRRWMEFLEDYDFTLHYHHGKANVVADALSRKSRGALASIASREWQMLETVGQFGLQYNEQTQGTLGSLVATPSLLSKVIESQWQHVEIVSIRDRVQSGTGDEGWTVHADGSLRYRGQVVVPQLTNLREEILREFHYSRFSVHPGGIREIVRLHGAPVFIVSDRDSRFMAHFWKSFQKAMGTRLTMSTTFHPQTDGQSERNIQVLEDMLRAYV